MSIQAARAGRQRARRSVFDRNDEVGQALERLILRAGERLRRVGPAARPPAPSQVDFRGRHPVDEAGRGQGHRQPAQRRHVV